MLARDSETETPLAPDNIPAQRLTALLGYVEQVIRMDERPAFKLADFRLANGQTYLIHQNELHALPGVAHDEAPTEDAPVWLRVKRLKRRVAPSPKDDIALWVVVSNDPEKPPTLLEFIFRTVSSSERDALITSGEAGPEDCQPSLDESQPKHFDVRLRVEDRPDVAASVEEYIGGPWLSWSNEEKPRRRSLALYQKLFEIAQLAELGGPDQAIEMVWGIGVARWLKDGTLVDLPIVECLVEIEINEASGGDIEIRPRQAPASVNLRPYDELKIDGVPLAHDAARRGLQLAEADGGITPFRREFFENVLRACQSQLDSEGRYLPDAEKIEPTDPLPSAAAHLMVSDRWVIFARKRSDNFLLNDIAKLKKSVEENKEELPGPATTLVMGPSDVSSAPWKPLSGSLGGDLMPDSDVRDEDSPLGDLFFPKPFNDEQVDIVRRLEQTDGVVVQGPPGTGKTHTISNIICHYLATGRRVLVVSHGEAALSVLRNHLPEEIRDLTISITTSEREGLKQVEGAIRLLQSHVVALKYVQQGKIIRDIEKSILGIRARLAAIDGEITEIAEKQLSTVRGKSVRPAELAKAVVADRASLDWFIDRPECFFADTSLTAVDVTQITRARSAVGNRLEYLRAVLPSLADLPSAKTIAACHHDIVQAAKFSAMLSANEQVIKLRIPNEAGVDKAERAANLIDMQLAACGHLVVHPWLVECAQAASPSTETHFGPIKALLADLKPFLAEHENYIRNPMEVPDDVIGSALALEVVDRLGKGDRAFRLFSFKEKALKPSFDAIRILSRSPANASEWQLIAGFIRWRIRLRELQSRWFALSSEMGLLTTSAATAPRELGRLATALQSVLIDAPAANAAVQQELKGIVVGELKVAWPDRERLVNLQECLRSAASVTRLSSAKAEIRRVNGLFPEDNAGRVGTLARKFLSEVIGRPDVQDERIDSAWGKVLAEVGDLELHRNYFDKILNISEKISEAGAPNWAGRLTTESCEGIDPVVPASWQNAWDWGAANALLSGIDQRERIQALTDERRKLDVDVAKAFERLVRERTFYALAKNMTGPVRAALMMLATALRGIGRGIGVRAERNRRAAREAMESCYDGVPCWIMPSWRVAEQLPSQLASFDLVIMDEASQSDIKEVTALLRGKKVLIVGDDKQVSPTAAFIENDKIDRLERTYLSKQPYKTLLLPGASLYDLAKVMFPDKFVMLREHFRCVEPIIRFSSQFYNQGLVPLRVPTALERIDPPLVDIYVSDGRRTGDKINHREAEIIVAEILNIVNDPARACVGNAARHRSIGVISLIGSKQAALINKMLLKELDEELILRHKISCGDSATFQGNERDIVFLSMVADPKSKQSQTASHFEQRFNVAMSRARDQLYVVHSVRQEELKEADLKARVLAHFWDPMKGSKPPTSDLSSRCDSDFEREILSQLMERGYRVTPQVGSAGYSIDLVVEGTGERRLAIECDGDKYHGPERWADDMKRQRVLERVGWRFWRCWASSYTLDPDGCIADLISTLDLLGVKPIEGDSKPYLYTEHRVSASKDQLLAEAESAALQSSKPSLGIQIGDRVVIRYLDDNKLTSIVLSRDRDDITTGHVSAFSPLGKQLIGCNEEDEVEFEAGGKMRKVLVVRTEREGNAFQ
jgi:very-short-patch-repair endonuclease